MEYITTMYYNGVTNKMDIRKRFIAAVGVRNVIYFEPLYTAFINYPTQEELKGVIKKMLLATFPEWLHELAKGPVKTQWGKVVFKAEDPLEEAHKIIERLEKDKKNSSRAIRAFRIVAPLLAERLAIAQYKLKNPRITPEAPEVLNYQEALEIALKEYPMITKEELANLLELLKNDPSMQPMRTEQQEEDVYIAEKRYNNENAAMTIQSKAINLFKYLQAIQEQEYNIVYNYTEYEWIKLIRDLPNDAVNISFYYQDYVKSDDNCTGLEEIPYILKVHNPNFEICPDPDEKLMPWLQEDWNDFHVSEPNIKERLPVEKSVPVQYKEFKNIADLQVMYNQWMEIREPWRKRQLQIEPTKDLFKQLFNHRQRLIKDDGDIELLIANGVFQTNVDERIIHPLLLKRVTIEFDAENNDIYIKDTDNNSSFYIELFNKLTAIDGDTIQQIDAENSQKQYYPLDSHETLDFFKYAIQDISPGGGGYFSSMKEAQEDGTAAFKLSWEPMLILRKSSSGMGKMIDRIIEKIDTTGEVPNHLIQLLEPKNSTANERVVENETDEEKLAAVGGEAIDILLPKEANQEQLEIARIIDNNDAVVVQGPPGTGKTHTIANLLGHFLAQGKRVLVTSHTNKALKVLKDKVVPELQPLCVSITDESKKDIESSIAAIANFSETPTKLERKIKEYQNQRIRIMDELNATRKRMLQIRNQQCNTIVLNGEEFSPIDAAKFVNANRETLGNLIPGRVEKCDTLPISYKELADLYASNEEVSADEEQQLACKLPSDGDIWPEDNFAQIVEKYQQNKMIVDELQTQTAWKFMGEDADSSSVTVKQTTINFNAAMKATLQEAYKTVSGIKDFEQWELHVIADGMTSVHTANWLRLVETINRAYDQYIKVEQLQLGKEINFSNLDEAKKHIQDYRKLIESDGKISFMQGLFNSNLKKAKQYVTINNAEITSGKDAELVVESLIFYDLENYCKIAWKQLFGDDGATYTNIEIAYKYATSIEKLLSWYHDTYIGILDQINSCGIDEGKIAPVNKLIATVEILQASLAFSKQIASKLIKGMLAFLELQSCKQQLETYYQQMSRDDLLQSAACVDMAKAIQSMDIQAYNQASKKLRILIAKYTLQRKRFQTLESLKMYAPEWANAIKKRKGIHGYASVPSGIHDAWKWKQLEQELNEINSSDYNELQKNTVVLARRYRKATAELAAAKAWYELQMRNMNNSAMQIALRGWVQLVKKIGKGTGKYAEGYRQQARNQMTQCQDAVPVWIMPVRKVLEMFDPMKMQSAFDIVIVDEASQSNITALAVTFLGKKVIVVGDDKQVSPLAVGVELAPVQKLAELYVAGWIPNSLLYTPKDSLYSIAFTANKSCMLLEHFRCVPEIIGYSNWLSYDNKIKPLREASSSNLLPAVINYRVDGHRDGKKKINQLEAKSIVALIQACIEQPEYNGKTFGVISLLGKEQANYIQMELFKTINNKEYENRQIICGDSANFQGDERDVIFLSMVDSHEGEGVERLLSPDANEGAYKKRYNVAASRAKDQLWVVNSLDEENSLQKGDLRRSLLSYAKNPQNYKQTLIQIKENAESPFEEAVAKALVSRGFHIVQQWEVGAYRIDMVAVYKNHKIAIECDGERYHSGSDKILEDMQRQTILERLGWKFIRIRGSEYYSDPDKTIDRVTELLWEYGIQFEDNFTATPNERNTELLQRVKQRANEILRGENKPTKSLKSDETQKRVQEKIPAEEMKRKEQEKETPIDQHKLNVQAKKISVEQPKPKEQIEKTPVKQSPTTDISNKEERLLTELKNKGFEAYTDGKEIWVVGEANLGLKLALYKGFKFSRPGSSLTSGRPGWVKPII